MLNEKINLKNINFPTLVSLGNVKLIKQICVSGWLTGNWDFLSHATLKYMRNADEP